MLKDLQNIEIIILGKPDYISLFIQNDSLLFFMDGALNHHTLLSTRYIQYMQYFVVSFFLVFLFLPYKSKLSMCFITNINVYCWIIKLYIPKSFLLTWICNLKYHTYCFLFRKSLGIIFIPHKQFGERHRVVICFEV
jgi:hypothetical protein